MRHSQPSMQGPQQTTSKDKPTNQGLVVFSNFTTETVIRNEMEASNRGVLWAVVLGLEEDGWGEILLFALETLFKKKNKTQKRYIILLNKADCLRDPKSFAIWRIPGLFLKGTGQ